MNYIWDITIKAHLDGFRKYELFFNQGKHISPWYEQSFTNINQSKIENTNIEINALYRFDDIFGRYFQEAFLEYSDFKKYFFDIIIHFLCELDLSRNISKESIYLSEIKSDIENNVWGKNIKDKLSCFGNQIDIIITLILLQLRVGSSFYIFKKAFKSIYPKAILYQMKKQSNLLLIYLGMKKSEIELNKIEFIQDMFLPLGFITRIFWDKHFGICGVNSTMVSGYIELF